MNKVYVGKITGCHGIKGELKILSQFEYQDRVFKENQLLLIDDNLYKITSVRVHKNFYLITINNIKDINEVNHLINKDVYINKEDLKLTDDEYLLEDLIGAKVMDKNEYLGQVTDILLGTSYNFVKVDNSFFIPLIDEYVDYFAKKEHILYTKEGKKLKIS